MLCVIGGGVVLCTSARLVMKFASVRQQKRFQALLLNDFPCNCFIFLYCCHLALKLPLRFRSQFVVSDWAFAIGPCTPVQRIPLPTCACSHVGLHGAHSDGYMLTGLDPHISLVRAVRASSSDCVGTLTKSLTFAQSIS